MSEQALNEILKDFEGESSLWQKTKCVINYHWGVGEVLERKTFRILFGAENMRAIDVYRNYLTNAGYMSIISRGKYECNGYVLRHLTIEDIKIEGELYIQKINDSIPI